MWEKKAFRRCTFCVMDTTDPDITFDQEGQCNHCKDYLQKVSGLIFQGDSCKQELAAISEDIKRVGKGKAYDCLIGVSGGVDSSYTCYLAKELGLRPLAVHLDNGWNSEEAIKNIKVVCDRLGIDYMSYVLNWEEFKDIQLAFLKASIVEMEMPTDVAIPFALHKVAAENDIKFILSGGNLAGEAILPRSWFYYPKDSKLLKAIHRRFGAVKIRNYPTFDYMDEMYYKFVKGIRILYPLNYVQYSKPEAMKLLQEKLGWLRYGGVHHESMYTRIVLSYLQPKKFGVDYRKCTLSAQICNGITSREVALAELEHPAWNPATLEKDKAYVAKKFGLGPGELDEIIESPPKSYRDYPNSEKWLDFVYGIYRRFLGGARSYHTASHDPVGK
jgi:N-acetyl sugar amidotransferase